MDLKRFWSMRHLFSKNIAKSFFDYCASVSLLILFSSFEDDDACLIRLAIIHLLQLFCLAFSEHQNPKFTPRLYIHNDLLLLHISCDIQITFKLFVTILCLKGLMNWTDFLMIWCSRQIKYLWRLIRTCRLHDTSWRFFYDPLSPNWSNIHQLLFCFKKKFPLRFFM